MKDTANVVPRDRKIFVLLSSDTEFDPPWQGHGSWTTRSTVGLLDGLPRFLEICDIHRASATLFCEGKLVQELPDLFRDLAVDYEIGCHSYSHEWLGTRPPSLGIPRREELAVLSTAEKKKVLGRAVEAITKTIGKKPRSFKAPFNSVDHPSTLLLLEQMGLDSDSSLPGYNTASFVRLIRPVSTRHTSEYDLWSEGERKLVEVPFTTRPRPLFFHPFDVSEEFVHTVSRGMKLALESVDVQLRVDSLLRKEFSVVHLASHPWSFSEVGPWKGMGKANAKRLDSFLSELTGVYDVEFLTVGDFVVRWENRYCRLHSRRRM